MATVSERAKWLANQVTLARGGGGFVASDEYVEVIEQALLAERRLVWADAMVVAYNTAGAKTRIIEALGAAAEKEK
jgi:hypothetical protein